MQRKIVFIELNEVPFRVIDAFCYWRPNSALSKVLPHCFQYETLTEDKTHLSPWKTWPTVHRGVIDEMHLIREFGQDLSEVNGEFPPIWQLLAANGISTGVCGSLHTYPLPNDLRGYSFFLPDTFATGSECFPAELTEFQQFNLRMARDSARNVSKRVPWGSALRFLASAPGLGLKLSTFMDISMQLAAEQIWKWKAVRRRTYQVVLAFDVFIKQLESTKPAFCTFFTNHVASAMHRYWAAAFPEDYDEYGYEEDWKQTYSGEIDFAMSKFDRWFHRLIQFVNRNDEYVLWVTTSMGQAATRALPIETQLYVSDIDRFMNALGTDNWSRKPAMLPQINVVVHGKKRAEFREALSALVIDGTPVHFREIDGFFSINFGHPNLDLQTSGALLRGSSTAFETLGLSNIIIDDKSGSSAYHVPQGALIVYDPRNPRPSVVRPQVSTLEIAPTILHKFGVEVPSYMRRPAAIA